MPLQAGYVKIPQGQAWMQETDVEDQRQALSESLQADVDFVHELF